MKKNNRGFTLVELIVSIAILGIIAVAAAGFLLAGTRSYTSVNYSVRLQYESQLVMSQIQNYVMNCNCGIAWENGTMYIVDTSDTGKTVNEIKLSGGKLMYGTPAAAETITDTAPDVMSEHVTGMTVTCTPNADTHRADTMQIKLQMKMGGKEYEATQTIALRNNPYYADGWSKLWGYIK